MRFEYSLMRRNFYDKNGLMDYLQMTFSTVFLKKKITTSKVKGSMLYAK